MQLRYNDPERALELSRAAVAECVTATFSEWRRAGSRCSGGLVLGLRDLEPGSGWGLTDWCGRPKAPWYALRRACAPIALLVTDEGVNGLRLHVRNDAGATLHGTVRVELFADGEALVDTSERSVDVAPRGVEAVDLATLFDGFRDLNQAYRFGPPSHDVVVATLMGEDGGLLADLAVLPLGRDRPVERGLGLRAVAHQVGDQWALDVSTERFAQSVALEIRGFDPEDSWFDLAPGRLRRIGLKPHSQAGDSPNRPKGTVRALNASSRERIELVDPGSDWPATTTEMPL